jgi:hypothetical protein
LFPTRITGQGACRGYLTRFVGQNFLGFFIQGRKCGASGIDYSSQRRKNYSTKS